MRTEWNLRLSSLEQNRKFTTPFCFPEMVNKPSHASVPFRRLELVPWSMWSPWGLVKGQSSAFSRIPTTRYAASVLPPVNCRRCCETDTSSPELDLCTCVSWPFCSQSAQWCVEPNHVISHGVDLSSETETTFHYCWRLKSSFKPPMQIPDWLLVDEALLLIGLTQTSFVENRFWLSRKRTIVFYRLSALCVSPRFARGRDLSWFQILHHSSWFPN